MSNFQHRPITDGCTGKAAQAEYLHKSDMPGIVGWTVGGVVVCEAVGETVGEMVEGALAERVELIIGRRVKVETVRETVDEEGEAVLEDTGGIVDGEGLTLEETADVKARGVMGERVAIVGGVVRTRDGESAVIERVATVEVVFGETGDEVTEICGVGDTVVLETTDGTVGEPLKRSVQYSCTQ